MSVSIPNSLAFNRENYLNSLASLEELLSAFLADNDRPIAPEECRNLAIAINGLIDGLWLEGSLAGDLFDDEALPRIALTSVESLLGGLSLSNPDAQTGKT